MRKTSLIEKYVKELFDMYQLSKLGFFVEMDEDPDSLDLVPIQLFPDDEVNDETLNRLSIKLGLTPEEIINCDKKAARRYWNKYPFFRLYSLFLDECQWNSKYKEKVLTEENLLAAIFNDDFKYPAERRYDYASVKDRLIKKLRDIDIYMPGTFHSEASITNLFYRTEFLFSFPEIPEMLSSFIDMIEKVKELFFKALNAQLDQNEVNEYNFLINALEITDIVMPSTLLTYDNVCLYKDAYIEEGFNDFFSYAKVRSLIGTGGPLGHGVNPWRAKEFFDDVEIVKKLVYIFPSMKEQLREFAMLVNCFECTFTWSDANPITFTEAEEKLLNAFDDMYVPMNERIGEPTTIYVEKTKEELFGWEPYIEQINRAILPPAKGGFVIRPRDPAPPRDIYGMERIQRRVELKIGGRNK